MSCVVLFLSCVCVCDLFLFLQGIHNTRIPSSIHTGASPHIHTQHPHPFVHSHRRFSSYAYTAPAFLRLFTPALLLIFIHNTRILRVFTPALLLIFVHNTHTPLSIHTGASPHIHTQHPHPFIYSHRRFSSYSYTTPAPLRLFTPALLLIFIHSTRTPSSTHTGASPHMHTQHPHPFVYSHRRVSSYSATGITHAGQAQALTSAQPQ